MLTRVKVSFARSPLRDLDPRSARPIAWPLPERPGQADGAALDVFAVQRQRQRAQLQATSSENERPVARMKAASAPANGCLRKMRGWKANDRYAFQRSQKLPEKSSTRECPPPASGCDRR